MDGKLFAFFTLQEESFTPVAGTSRNNGQSSTVLPSSDHQERSLDADGTQTLHCVVLEQKVDCRSTNASVMNSGMTQDSNETTLPSTTSTYTTSVSTSATTMNSETILDSDEATKVPSTGIEHKAGVNEITSVARNTSSVNTAETSVLDTVLSARPGTLPKPDTKYLRDALPSHAFPDRFIALTALPVTRHGKVDASALKELYQRLGVEDKKHGSGIGSTRTQQQWRDILLQEWKVCVHTSGQLPTKTIPHRTGVGPDEWLYCPSGE